MKKYLFYTVIILLFSNFSHATDVIKEGKEYPIEKLQEQSKKIIKMVVKEISKTLPQKVDNYTDIVKIRDENLTLIYTFEIKSNKKSDEEIKKEDRERMQKNITKGVCQSSKRFLDAGVTLTYEYLSAKTKKELFAFTMTQQICKELQND